MLYQFAKGVFVALSLLLLVLATAWIFSFRNGGEIGWRVLRHDPLWYTKAVYLRWASGELGIGYRRDHDFEVSADTIDNYLRDSPELDPRPYKGFYYEVLTAEPWVMDPPADRSLLEQLGFFTVTYSPIDCPNFTTPNGIVCIIDAQANTNFGVIKVSGNPACTVVQDTLGASCWNAAFSSPITVMTR